MVHDKAVVEMRAIQVVGVRANANRVEVVRQLAPGPWGRNLFAHEQMLSLDATARGKSMRPAGGVTRVGEPPTSAGGVDSCKASGVPTDVQGDADEVFSEPEANVIESSAGYSIRVLGRTGLEYSERARSVSLDSEVLAKPRAIAIYTGSATLWKDPEQPELLSDADRARVVANIERAFRACGYEPEMLGPFDWNSGATRRPD